MIKSVDEIRSIPKIAEIENNYLYDRWRVGVVSWSVTTYRVIATQEGRTHEKYAMLITDLAAGSAEALELALNKKET